MNRRIVLGVSLAGSLIVASTAFSQPKPADTPLPVTQPTLTKPTSTPMPSDDPWAGRTDLFIAPATHPSTKVSLGKVDRFTLPNGLKVIAVPRHGAPVVNVALIVALEESAEPLDRAGLADFTAEMLHKGTERRTADQLADEIDTAGATLRAEKMDEGIVVLCNGRSRDLALCLDSVSDVSIHPTFPDAELGDVQSQMLANVESSRDNPQQLATITAANLFYGDEDPRGRSMSKKTIAAIDRPALVAFHKAWFQPGRGILAVAGDFQPKALKAQLTKFFGGWQNGATPRTEVLEQPKAGALKIRLVDKPDATQAQIVIFGPGIRHADPELCAVRLMNYSLGEGTFSSRLMKVVRSENAKTYHASSHFSAHRDPGPFQANTFTRESEAASTAHLMLDEIDKMKQGGPTKDELVAAKANLIGGYGLEFETASDVAFRLVLDAADALAPDFATTYPSCLDKVGLSQAAAAAKAHLQPTALVILGNASKLGPQLAAAKLGTTDVVRYTDPVSAAERSTKKAAADSAKKAAALAPQADLDAGKKILAVALQAKGTSTITKIGDLYMKGTGQMMEPGGQTLPIGFDAYYAPNQGQQREAISMAGQAQIQVLDGDQAFVKMGGNTKDQPRDIIDEQKRDLWHNPHLVLLNAAREGVQLRALPVVDDKKAKYDVINVITPTGDSIELELDQKTHMLVKETFTADGTPTTITLGDYQSADGVQFARKWVMTQGPTRIEMTLDQIKLNKGVPKDAFKR